MPVPLEQDQIAKSGQRTSLGTSMQNSVDRRGSLHRFVEKLTPRRSRPTPPAEQDAMQQSCPEASFSPPSKSPGRGSLAQDLRRSLNQLFHHKVRADMRAFSEHELNSHRVDTLRFEPHTGLSELDSTQRNGAADFSSDALAKMTKPLAGAYLSDGDVSLPNDLAKDSGHQSPSYLRVSCALSGYRRNLGPRCSSSLSTNRPSVSPSPNRLLCLTNMYNASPPLPHRSSAPTAKGHQSGALEPSAKPMEIKEIIDNLDRLSLRDNSPALRLLASCQERRKQSQSSGSKVATGDQKPTGEEALVCDNGLSERGDADQGALVTADPVEIISDAELLPLLRGADYFKELAAMERYRLESLCDRLQERVREGQSDDAGRTTELIDKTRTLVNDVLKPFQRQLEEEEDKVVNGNVETAWNRIAAEINEIDASADVADEFNDSVIWSPEEHGDLTPDGCRVDGRFYERTARAERARLEEICRRLSADMETCASEEGCDRMRMAVGKVTLLLGKKFKKFEDLVQRHLEPVEGQPLVTLDDLDGFWTLVQIELANIEGYVEAVERLRRNDWVPEADDEPVRQDRPGAGEPEQAPAKKRKKRWLGQKVTEARQRLMEVKRAGRQRMVDKNDAQVHDQQQSNGQ